MCTVLLEKTTHKKVSPREFVHIYEEQRENIKSTKIIPPKMGQYSMGKIEITLKHPVYE